ncbi:MAG: S8/S53 family peptidase [Nocardioides sp.]|nr:S8/S53 family peptidase [Nocardioides sp.]
MPRQPEQSRREREPRLTVAYGATGTKVLDPASCVTVDGVSARSTIYSSTALLISKSVDVEATVARIREVAETYGWSVELDPEPEHAVALRFGVRRVRLGVVAGRAAPAPDAWTVLQLLRAGGLDRAAGVSLEHVLVPDPVVGADPHNRSNPHNMPNPHNRSNADDGYDPLGTGGRQPVAYVGLPPYRREDGDLDGRERPVVAVLDTGCGPHPWLDFVQRDVRLDGHPIGWPAAAPDSEVDDDQVGPLDGVIDPLAGHGTFIAGLIHQACPDADILSWRIVPPEGPIAETDWLTALAQIAELVHLYRLGDPRGRRIDVLSMSMGYYHETPADRLFDGLLYEILADLAANGTLVVCSAGNDATARPMFPAAFAPWSDGRGPVAPRRGVLPIVSVGALNPNGTTDTIFSNTGPWVRAYEIGAGVVSTFPPTFEGGYQPSLETTYAGRKRTSLDPDDFTGGFGTWSGTSFAAPILAGRFAQRLLESAPGGDVRQDVKRAWAVLQELTELRPVS